MSMFFAFINTKVIKPNRKVAQMEKSCCCFFAQFLAFVQSFANKNKIVIKSLEKKANDYYFIKHCFRGSKKRNSSSLKFLKRFYHCLFK